MYQFLAADVAAAVSGPSDVLQLLSLAHRSDQTHSLLSPVPPHSEVLSLAAKLYYVTTTVRSVQYDVIYWTASGTGSYCRIRSGYFQGQIIEVRRHKSRSLLHSK